MPELVRLMASLRFWCVFAVDMTCLAGTVIWLVGADLLGSVDMLQILLALFLSQVVAFVVAVMLLPAHDRHLAPWRPARSTRRISGSVNSRARMCVVKCRKLTSYGSMVVPPTTRFWWASFAAMPGKEFF